MTTKRYAGLGLLHPKAFPAFVNLNNHLASAYEAGKTKTLFKPFESFRGADRQDQLFAQGTTKARAWQSAHQYGLAVDFVPFNGSKWSWDNKHDWDFLAHAANIHGLLRPISWDLAHVHHPLWNNVRKILLDS